LLVVPWGLLLTRTVPIRPCPFCTAPSPSAPAGALLSCPHRGTASLPGTPETRKDVPESDRGRERGPHREAPDRAAIRRRRPAAGGAGRPEREREDHAPVLHHQRPGRLQAAGVRGGRGRAEPRLPRPLAYVHLERRQLVSREAPVRGRRVLHLRNR